MIAQNKRYWKVAIPKPIDELFTYHNDTGQDLTGFRVLVPFGKNNKNLPGVVVEEATVSFIKRTKPILEILDTVPAFNANMIKFISWIADYYIAPIGETFKSATPAGISPKALIKFLPNREKAEQALQEVYQSNPVRWKLLSFLLSTTNKYSIEYLEHYLEIPNIQYHINYLLERDLIYMEQIYKQVSAKFVKAVKLNNRLLEDNEFLKETLSVLDKKASKQSELVAFVLLWQRRTNQPVALSKIKEVIANPNSVVTSLEKKQLVEVVNIEIDRSQQRNGDEKLATKNEFNLKLTEEQELCVNAINNAVETNTFNSFLLYGVTGSGKTLVYIHTIQKTLLEGKSVLLLVPEISLTPQLIDRFDIVFPGMITVFHSKLSEGERYDAWRSVLHSKTKIVIGPRSALFAPLSNIGLIIVDEEHESSYKQETQQPYYQARDAAIMRAKIENATVVLGSATPSIESYYNAKIGKYKLLEIRKRADNAQLPNVNLINMISARKNGQVNGDFSRTLIDNIKEKIDKKEGVILFQNKRGFASYLECHDCGYIPQCKHCSVSLTYHQPDNELRCHYCGYTRKAFKTCENCGAVEMHLIGSGTQRIEEKLNDILTLEKVKCNIARLDLDTAKRKGSHRSILQKFANGQTDVLLGTQMIAKGLDFDRVTLVGVINADLQLRLPDFRATERTVQLLLQVAGRAGRSGEHKGEVVIQTSLTSDYVMKTVKNNDYMRFVETELENRLSAKFPPFVRFCVIEFIGKKEDVTKRKAEEFYSILLQRIEESEQIYKQAIICYPPQSPLIEKINDRYRVHIALKSIKKIDMQGKYLRTIIKNTLNIYSKKYASATVTVKIDMDSYIGY